MVIQVVKQKLLFNQNNFARPYFTVDFRSFTAFKCPNCFSGEAEKRYLDLMKKKEIVVNDKLKINNVIKDLDEKKNKAVVKAWEQVTICRRRERER